MERGDPWVAGGSWEWEKVIHNLSSESFSVLERSEGGLPGAVLARKKPSLISLNWFGKKPVDGLLLVAWG